jgi:hypothetical protein
MILQVAGARHDRLDVRPRGDRFGDELACDVSTFEAVEMVGETDP